MKKIINMHFSKQTFFFLIISICFFSCKKWTEVKPIEIIKEDISDINPTLYKEYLEDLRKYKSTEHRITIGWYDNSNKIAFNQSHHITKLPDSIDYILLKYPDNLSEKEIVDISKTKEEKATKFLFEIDMDAYIKTHEQMSLDEKKKITLFDYVKNSIDSIKDLSLKYPYDGLVISYTGMDTIHLKDKSIQKSIQNLFTETSENWIRNNSSKEYIYKGNPQTIFNKSILKQAKYIILPTLNSISKVNLSFILANANVEDVPKDKFIVLANSVSYKPEEISKKIGIFSNGEKSIASSTEWLLSDQIDNIKIKGLGIENIQYDYFNITKSYKYSREAINKMNPSLKK